MDNGQELLQRKQELLLKQRDLLQRRQAVLQEKYSAEVEVSQPVSLMKKVENRVQERGRLNPEKSLFKLAEKGVMPKVVGTAELMADPFKRIEATISNPLIDMQSGNTNMVNKSTALTNPFLQANYADIKRLGTSAIDGFRGKKLGEFGDLYVCAGVPEPLAATFGLATDIVLTGGLIEKGIKGVTKGITKTADKVLLRGVDDIVEGVDKARAASVAITNGFWKQIDNVSASLSDDALDAVARIPKSVIGEIEEQLGKRIEQVSNLSDLRKVKQVIAKSRPSTFGKAERGIEENLMGEKVNRAYAYVSENIMSILKKVDPKRANELAKVNKHADDIISASNIVRHKLLGPNSEKKAESAIGAVTKRSGADFRKRAKEIGEVTPQALRSIQKGIIALRNAATREALSKLLAGAGRSVVVGGVAGQMAGNITRKSLKENQAVPMD